MKLFTSAILFLLCSLLLAQQRVVVLGIAQDGGFPHIGCQKECQLAHKDPTLAKYVVSLALVDEDTKKWWLFEATPDMDRQLQYFQELTKGQYPYLPESIFLTHAHIGHYTGLMFLGREALGANGTKVYALPKMRSYLQSNGPWSQLVSLGNIELMPMNADQPLTFESDISITPFQVPHRDEFSETAGFKIVTSTSSYLFIPDIDKWDTWERNIIEEVKSVEYAFLDAAFFKDGELPNRPMSEIPHPFVEETMSLFEEQSRSVKKRVVFIHLNHTNPLLFDKKAKIEVLKKGYRIAEQGTDYN